MGALDPDCVTCCPGLQPPSSVLGAEGGWGLDGLLFLLAVGPSVFFFQNFFLIWTIFKVFIEFVTILFLVFIYLFCKICGISAS